LISLINTFPSSNRTRSGFVSAGNSNTSSFSRTQTVFVVFPVAVVIAIATGTRKTGIPREKSWTCATLSVTTFRAGSHSLRTSNTGCPGLYSHWSKNQSRFCPVTVFTDRMKSLVSTTSKAWVRRKWRRIPKKASSPTRFRSMWRTSAPLG
jgi:hypothetical protein